MDCPAASDGVSWELFIIVPGGRELSLYPPLEGLGLPTSGGIILVIVISVV